MTETEYDEFLRLNEEIHKVEDINMDSFYERVIIKSCGLAKIA